MNVASGPPRPHFTATVEIKEVTPAWRASSGGGPLQGGVVHERQVEDVLRVVVRGDSARQAISSAIAQLETALDSLPEREEE